MISFVYKHLATLVLFIYLLTIGAFFQKNRKLMHQFRNQFRFFKKPPAKTNLKKIKLSELVRTTMPILLAEPLAVQGNVTMLELTALNLFAQTQEPKTIFEIGTFDGRTTLNLALNCAPDARIYTIDLPKDEVSSASLAVARSDQNLINTNVTGSRFVGSDKNIKEKIVQLYGDTAHFDFTPYHSSIDMIFIDGAHTYEYVMNDSRIAQKLLRNGKGAILWHDYDPLHEGSIRAVEEVQSQNPDWRMFHIEGTNLAGVILK